MPVRTLIEVSDISLDSLGSINIVLGRNGAGKSRLLRRIDAELESNPEYNLRYVSPERAGVFRKDGNTETNLERDPGWLRNVRRKNQAENFKAASAYFLRDVELAYLRRLQNTPELRNDPDRNFRTDRLEKINRLLSNISLDLEGASFVFKGTSKIRRLRWESLNTKNRTEAALHEFSRESFDQIVKIIMDFPLGIMQPPVAW